MYAYDEARQAVATGDLRLAEDSLSSAIAMDPGMALYWRQRGAVRLIRGNANGAVSDLAEAAKINPHDDLGWRALAAAETIERDFTAASDAIAVAARLQRSDPANLLMASRIASEAGDPLRSRDLLAAVVQAWPAVTGAPLWRESLPTGVETREIVADARSRWQSGVPSPEPLADQPLWLAAMDGAAMGANARIPSSLTEEMREATVAVLTCSRDATDLLAAVDDSDKRSKAYWALVAANEARSGSPQLSLRLLNAIATASVDPRLRVRVLNPLDEDGIRGNNVDKWGYRRTPIRLPIFELQLPSPEWGYEVWLRAPSAAIREAGLTAQFPGCGP
jgi:tetratricopeptide (TPR) repeat protein